MPLTHCLVLENHITSLSVHLFPLNEKGNAICFADVWENWVENTQMCLEIFRWKVIYTWKYYFCNVFFLSPFSSSWPVSCFIHKTYHNSQPFSFPLPRQTFGSENRRFWDASFLYSVEAMHTKNFCRPWSQKEISMTVSFSYWESVA